MKLNSAVDTYLATFEGEVYQRLLQLRAVVVETCPDVVEGIMYGLAGYKLDGVPLVYFGGYKNHIGVYATPNAHSAFSKELALYKQGEGSVQFPNNAPFPVELIERMIIFRRDMIRA